MIQKFFEFLDDRRACMELEDAFLARTGHPIYQATLKEGRAFRQSGMTAHDWIILGNRGKTPSLTLSLK